ncbi:hypothetical protein QYF61_015696 [Mycteria americana]|uniref:Uncharacterized protein n=1 Tax=Mycteria americana TaxID=33587 RepID=A0AAN7NKK3_MYCAM|nr:hypothetical protein QYF61_015696 [Mycteria americana]
MSLSTSSKRLLNTSREGDSTTSLGSLVQCLITLTYKPPLAQLEAISSRPIARFLGEETDTHLATASFQGVVESNKVSPQPPFLQAKQPQFPQPLLTGLVLQTLHQLRCPSLDTLQPLNVSLVVRGPKLNTGFEVRPHQCRVQGDNHFPAAAGHSIPDTSQDAIGFLATWAHCWLVFRRLSTNTPSCCSAEKSFTAVAATATASCSQHRLAEQACGSPSYSQPEEKVKHISRSHCLQPGSSNVVCGAVLATATHQDFAKPPAVPEKQENMGSQQGLQSLTCQMCNVDPPGYFLFHILLVPYERLHRTPKDVLAKPFPSVFRICWVMESPVTLSWHVYVTTRGALEGRQQGCTLNDLAVIREDWPACLRAWAKARARSHTLTKPRWSQQLGKLLRRQSSPTALYASENLCQEPQQAGLET